MGRKSQCSVTGHKREDLPVPVRLSTNVYVPMRSQVVIRVRSDTQPIQTTPAVIESPRIAADSELDLGSTL